MTCSTASRAANTKPTLPYKPGKWLTLDVDFSVAEGRRDARWHNSRNEWND